MSKKTWFNLTIFFAVLNLLLLTKIYIFSSRTPPRGSDTVHAKSKKTSSSTISNRSTSLDSALTKKIFADSNHMAKLLLVYPRDYCGACINFSLPFLQKLYNEKPNKLVILNPVGGYNLSTMISKKKSSETYIRNVNTNSYKTDRKFPLFLVVTHSGLIIDHFVGRISTPNKVQNFFEKVNFYLNMN